jgi:hypothetical protein
MRQLREDLADAVEQGSHSNKYEHELRELRDAIKQAQVSTPVRCDHPSLSLLHCNDV